VDGCGISTRDHFCGVADEIMSEDVVTVGFDSRSFIIILLQNLLKWKRERVREDIDLEDLEDVLSRMSYSMF
jgi:hypothetical protein